MRLNKIDKLMLKCIKAIEKAIYDEDGLDGAEGQKLLQEIYKQRPKAGFAYEKYLEKAGLKQEC
jgi:hypothetical protein